MKSFTNFLSILFAILAGLTLSTSVTVSTDPDVCKTAFTGCLKCTDDATNNCLICKQGWKLKQFSGIISSSASIDSFGGTCISAVDTYQNWKNSISSNSKIAAISEINSINKAQEIINLYIQIFSNPEALPTLDILERVITASFTKSQLLAKLQETFMPVSSQELAVTIVYGMTNLLQIEYALFEELKFVPDGLYKTVTEDLNLIAEVFEELKADMTYSVTGEYILSKMTTTVSSKIFTEFEEWVQTEGYFPNGKPSEVDDYMLSLMEDDTEELLMEETKTELQKKIDSALHNLILLYSGFNPTIDARTFNFAEFSITFLRNQVDSTTLQTKAFSVTIPEDGLQKIADQNAVDKDTIILLNIGYKHVNPFGENPQGQMTSVANIQSYSVKMTTITSYPLQSLQAIEMKFPTLITYSIEFILNAGTHEWQCLEYNSEWKVLSTPTNQDIATITCKYQTFGTIGFQQIVMDGSSTWANIGMHCTWLWLTYVGLLCLVKIAIFQSCINQQSDENKMPKSKRFAPFTVSMPISLLSASSWSDLAYKGLFTITYFSTICVALSYNIQENSNDTKETWMDFYMAFRILIFAWVLKYFFGILRIIQKDCFQNQAPLSAVLIIVYFIEMYYCQRELGTVFLLIFINICKATNDRQKQWLLSLVTAVIMDLVIDFLLAIIISLLFQEAKLGVLSFMRLGGFATAVKPEFIMQGYEIQKDNEKQQECTKFPESPDRD